VALRSPSTAQTGVRELRPSQETCEGQQEATIRALARMTLWPREPNTKRYRLPGEGNRSFLYRFGQPDAMHAAVAMTVDGADFVPGGSYSVTLDFWHDDTARAAIRAGDAFTVWYGGDIGTGEITALP
jgi:hypothetical protein